MTDTPTPPATSTVEWHKVKDGDEVIVGGRRIVFRVLPFRADPHPTPPAPDAAHPALIAAARERDALRDALRRIVAVLSPTPPPACCEGGKAEIEEAVEVARAALKENDRG